MQCSKDLLEPARHISHPALLTEFRVPSLALLMTGDLRFSTVIGTSHDVPSQVLFSKALSDNFQPLHKSLSTSNLESRKPIRRLVKMAPTSALTSAWSLSRIAWTDTEERL
jgi:hypothetical protein